MGRTGVRIACWLCCMGLVAAGCRGGIGPPKFPVSGMVTANGEPIPTGTINFFPAQGVDGPSAGAEIKDGRYSIPEDKGLVAGQHSVQIRATRGTGEMIHPGYGAPEDARVERTEQYIPEIYNRNTTLVVQIREGENDNVNFDLEIP